MPSTTRRNPTTAAGATVPITPGLMTAPTRARGASKRGNAGTTGQQWLSLDRTTASHVITKELTANQVASYINTLCAVDAKTPGVIAKDPTWAYNLAVQMFSGD
jgi:hypothetical protein